VKAVSRKRRLEAVGWRVGTAPEFLGLSDWEATYLDLKLQLAHAIRERRRQRRLTQGRLAKLLRSSQSAVAKMEGGDPSISIDPLVRSLLALGASLPELAEIISSRPVRRVARGPGHVV
jgi:predicted XRE-type DNA-binding protein